MLKNCLGFLERLSATLFIIAVPLFLIAGSVAWAVNDAGLYQRGFEKYDISAYSGITDEDLVGVGADLRRYFNSSVEPLHVVVPIHGMERQLFNQREVHHMRDVKGLVRGTYLVALLAGLYLVAMVAGGYCRRRHRFSPDLARLLLKGGALTLALVAGIGLFALVGFDSLFLFFHQVSFTNDLWQLDPRSDYLLIMFPQGFWFDATMRVALTTIIAATILPCLGGGYLLYRKRTGQNPAQPHQ